jgi:hypothetical protein
MRNAYKSFFSPKALKEDVMRGRANGFKEDVKKQPQRMWTRFIWLRIQAGGWIL